MEKLTINVIRTKIKEENEKEKIIREEDNVENDVEDEDKNDVEDEEEKPLEISTTFTFTIPPHANIDTVHNSLIQIISSFIYDNNLDGSQDFIDNIDDPFINDDINQCIEDAININEE